MAEPVIVPVRLECVDIDTSNIDFKDAQKTISTQMSAIKKSINDAFSGIDASAINKSIDSAMTSVKKSVQAAEDAQLRYRMALSKAGESTREYREATADLDARVANLQETLADYKKKGYTWVPEYKEIQQELENAITARKKIDPIQFADKADGVHLERIANTYKKVLSAQENLNKKSEEFNQTAKDNRTTDDYNELLKQAEAYKKKLDELNEKSKRMEALGATDKQWEALQYDTQQVSNNLDDVVKKMREMVKSGSALRFGDGPKADLSRQINSLAMSGGNRAGNIQKRAKENQSPYTEDYQNALNELDKLEKKMQAIQEKYTKMMAEGAPKEKFAGLVTESELLDTKIDELKNSLMGMVNSGQAFKFGNGNAETEINNIRDKSNGLQSSLSGVVTNAKKAQGGLTALSATNPKLAAVLNVVGKIAQGFGKVIQVAGKVGKVIVKGFVGAVKVIGKVASAAGKVVSAFGRVAKSVGGAVKNLFTFGKSGSKTSNDLGSKFKKLNKNILMWGFGFRTAYYAIKRLRNIFIESFKVMGDQFDEVGQPMMRMMESFNRLKGSLATAFQPLVSVVIPILTTFMNYLSGVLEGVGKFMATLTGQKQIYKAVAKDINSVADAAGNANDKLGAYDKLEVISQDNNNTGVDYEMQELGAEDAASNFAQMVKDAWESADFTSVGQYVTEQLLGVLANIEANVIPKVTAFANKILQSINTFFDGFDATAVGDAVGSIVNTLVEGLDWAQVGMLFANLNNVIWEFLDGLVNQIDWAMFGQSLATGIQTMFDTLNFDSWVGMISGLVNGITTAIINLLSGVDWAGVAVTLGTTVSNLFTSIDPVQIGTAINLLFSSAFTFIESFFSTDAVGSMTTALTTLITTVDWDSIGESLVNAVQIVLQSVGAALAGSDNPLFSAIGNIVLTLSDVINTLMPAVESIISTIWPITEAILPTITELLPPIAELIAQAVTMVMPVLVSLVEAIMPILIQLTEILLPIIMDVLGSLQPIFDAITNTVLPVTVHLLEACMPLIEGILNLITDIIAPISSLIGPLLEIVFKIIDPLITILSPLMEILGVICDVLGDVLRPILDVLTPLLDYISELFSILSPVIDILVTPLKRVADVFKLVGSLIKGIVVPAIQIIMGIIEAFCNVAKNMADVVKRVFEHIAEKVVWLRDKFKEPINAILGMLENFVNWVIRAVNKIIQGINKISIKIPDWLGGGSIGFNIKEISEVKIPRLAQGAVIPPNKEFLAVLGDQRHGTNIEAPLDTIKQALAEVLAELGGMGNNQPIVLQVNGRTLAQVVWDEQEKRYKQTGRSMA